MDDQKVSHVDNAVVTVFPTKLVDLYKERAKSQSETVLDYLGMDPNSGSLPGALLVSMIKYTTKVLE